MGTDWGLIVTVFGALFALGFGYNLLVGWLQRRGYAEGYEWALVAVGTLLALAGVAIIDWQAALLALGAFASAGWWMAVGSWWRYVRRRARGQEEQILEVVRPEIAEDDEGS